ncbi:MAG TPA: hypothetical protein VGU20_22785 [Stellaceae bacterium]|nr:hypothetical protein [Stellaceae bacterium]
MDSEIDKLRRDLKRYRFLLGANSDQHADQVIRELIADTEARLRALEAVIAPTAVRP